MTFPMTIGVQDYSLSTNVDVCASKTNSSNNDPAPALQQKNGSTPRNVGMRGAFRIKFVQLCFTTKTTSKISNHEYEPNRRLIKFDRITSTTEIHVYIKLTRIKVKRSPVQKLASIYSKPEASVNLHSNLNVSIFQQLYLN